MPLERPQALDEEEIAKLILDAGAVDIRNINAGEDPFLYSTGNRGPGYINVKGLVGRQETFKQLTEQTALRLLTQEAEFDFIAANATGGMAPGYQVREDYQRFSGREVPYIYVRNTRKIGGHQEYTTGLTGNPEIAADAKPLVFEELVNYAGTTGNSAIVLRQEGHEASHAGAILHYENPVAVARLQELGLTLIYAVGLPKLLEVAEETGKFRHEAVDDFRAFLSDPKGWQQARGFEPVELDNE